MRTLQLALVMLILVGCEKQEIISETRDKASREFANVTWELMEIRNLAGEWVGITGQQKHFLTFVNDSIFEYADAEIGCTGSYLFETLENSIHTNRLILKAPCMMPAEQLWWEHLIEERTDDEVITYPHIANTAYMSYERFKYKIVFPTNQ